jgi:hypothetical protein
MMRLRIVTVATLLSGVAPAGAQDAAPAIADNSFLIEEAYNQEPGVVQHISTLTLVGPERRDAVYGFTQEWPFRSQRHQLSYTAVYAFRHDAPDGFGDLMLNYRMQVAGTATVAVAPRLSAILPTGREQDGLGDGSVGGQFNLPVSVRLTPALVGHLNAGATVLARARGVTGTGDPVRATLTSWTLGGSLIGPVTRPVNLMLEFVQSWSGEFTADGSVAHPSATILSPGVRFAVNLGGAQVVPGVGVPVTFAGGDTTTDVLLYLSLEHAFRRTS